jgi:hypothetical protein
MTSSEEDDETNSSVRGQRLAATTIISAAGNPSHPLLHYVTVCLCKS